MTTIVVPIFNAIEEAATCLQSLADRTPDRAKVILINDASTDPSVAQALADIPDHWVVVHNEKNIGFVATANLGMALAAPDDVLLLNADTEVTTGWLDEMEACLGSDPAIASVSPLTNHGEIASIPLFCQANSYPEDAERWAVACRHSSDPAIEAVWTEVPTTIGFCMLIRRQVLHEIGCFDEQAFGRGYGEENDWCQRAIQSGWRHVLCDRAYVAHQGGASFGPLGLTPGGEALRQLAQRYPNYESDVAEFIKNDPMASRRQQIVEYYQKTPHNSGS